MCILWALGDGLGKQTHLKVWMDVFECMCAYYLVFLWATCVLTCASWLVCLGFYLCSLHALLYFTLLYVKEESWLIPLKLLECIEMSLLDFTLAEPCIQLSYPDHTMIPKHLTSPPHKPHKSCLHSSLFCLYFIFRQFNLFRFVVHVQLIQKHLALSRPSHVR